MQGSIRCLEVLYFEPDLWPPLIEGKQKDRRGHWALTTPAGIQRNRTVELFLKTRLSKESVRRSITVKGLTTEGFKL